MKNDTLAFLRNNKDSFLLDFIEFLKIPSISTNTDFAGDVQKAAVWILDTMNEIGIQNAAIIQTDGHPMVCGEWLEAGADKPTVLLYAHYDVQPADPLELWESPPFEPTERDGKLFARGIVDDKIGVFGCLKAVEALLADGSSLPVNIKFLFEGEEETGSPNAPAFLQDCPERIASDIVVICDGSGPTAFPIVTYSCRGLVAAEVTITGPPQDMHSGSAGGLVENPAHVAAAIVSSIHDNAGRILIPGFDEGAVSLSEKEREKFGAIENEYVEEMKRRLGDFHEWGDPEFTALERLSVRPTCDVNGIYGGYQGEGLKTIIPSRAGFKVSMRIAPGQNPQDIGEKFRKHVMAFDSPSANVEVKLTKFSWPATSDPESKPVKALERACRNSWNKEPLLTRMGGTVPIAGLLQRATGKPLVFLSPGVGGLIHSPNEFMHLDFFTISLETVVEFLIELGEG